MQPVSSTSTIHDNALPTGYQLEEYRIQAILSHKEFSVTYLANDTQQDMQVVIKEFLPNELTVRKDDYTLQPKSKQDADNFAWGLEQFVKESRILASLDHPNIVHIQRFFRANNTAYFVMDYEQGQSLAELFKEDEIASEEELMAMLPPLLDGLRFVHKAKYLHRNIKPSNIYLRDEDQSPVLIGFGAVHYDMGDSNIAATLTPGYASFEQYQTKGNQGAWTDIYALGAVLYRLISGTTPTETTARIDAIVYEKPDPLMLAVEIGGEDYSEELLEAIDWALEIRETDRPQTVKEWAKAIPREFLTPSMSSSNLFKRAFSWILFIVIVAIFLGGGYFFYTKWQASEKTSTAQESTKPKQQALVDTSSVRETKEPSVKVQPQPRHTEEDLSTRYTEPLVELQPDMLPSVQPKTELQLLPKEQPLPSVQPKTELQPLPEEQPVEQPFVQVEPEQFIQDYYTAISNQQYETTWKMLSRRFKGRFHCCNSDGSYKMDSYLKWWGTINKVEVLTMKVLEQNNETATVKAKLRYFFIKRKVRVVTDTHTFILVTDTENNWLIEEQR